MSNNYKYFGTDGIRGKVGCMPITPDFFLKLGWAVGNVLSKYYGDSGKIIIGKDTRISGYMLESALEAGLAAAGLSVSFTGYMPTPAIAYLTRISGAEAGIVISGSHNPFYDNGVKFFSSDGTKLSKKMESAIEAELTKILTCVKSSNLGKISRIVDAARQYIEFCKSSFPKNLNLKGLKIIVDCANGATYHIAPIVLRELGATVIAVGCQPNGININYKCGATNINILQNIVLNKKADLGIAYDGDGDRIIMVDHLGYKIDGDKILYIIAREKLHQGQLFGGAVGTFMSNTGLELALKKLRIPFIRTDIGDYNVLEKMREKSWLIGAESSGHIILLDKTTTGDGIIAGLQVLSAMVINHTNLHDLCVDVVLLPQIIINIRFSGKNNPLELLSVRQANAEAEYQLSGKGRVLLRKSGTEPLIRVMVEGEDTKQVSKLVHYIASIVKSAN